MISDFEDYSRYALRRTRMSALHRLSSVSRPVQHTSRQRRRTLAAINFDLAVDDYKVDPQRILIRIFKGRAIDYGLRIKDGDVRKVAFTNQTALLQTQIAGGQARHLMNREFE